MGRLAGKVAIVTGAGQGIGEAIAIKMAVEGAAVIIAEINEETGTQVAAAIQGRDNRAMFVRTDVTSEDDISAAVNKTVEEFGKLDILVNNAGKNFYYDATEMTEMQWNDAMSLDLKSAWLCCKYAIPEMVKQGGGAIVNISSIHARMTVEGMFPYAAAKSGLIGLTRSLALDWGTRNIRVNAICPGWVRTQLVEEWLKLQGDPDSAEAEVLKGHPLQRMATPDEIANFVAFIASDEASYITGGELLIDGGLSARFAT